MEKQEEYFRLLKLQYYKATKEKLRSYFKDSLSDEIYEWLLLRKQIGEKYLEYLQNLNIDITKKGVAEIGKGSFDTLVRDYETTIISPYMEGQNNERILPYSLNLVSSPTLMKYGPKERIEDIYPIPKHVNSFLISNPYEKGNIFGLEKLINNNVYKVIIGIYGQNDDKDKNNKLKMLYRLSKQIKNNEYRLNYEQFKDYYYATLINNSKIKIK